MMALHKQAVSRFRKFRHDQQFRHASILDDPEANEMIRQRIESKKPLMISRFGACEINVLNTYRQRCRNSVSQRIQHLLTGVPLGYTEKTRLAASNNAGIFPATDEILDRFSQIIFQACQNIDLLGVWRFLRLEEQLQKETCPTAALIRPQAVEPYYHSSPWSSALRGKKVLVIHPFEKSIRRQYLKREKLFPSSEVLSEFEIKTIKAVQSAAGNPVEFASWVEAFESMQKQMESIEFDVALIGAGAYGLPLAAHAKSMGRQAVHMGGALQIFFGIKGGRWDENPEINRFYNEHWTRPLPEETPAKSGDVEEGCYW